MKMHMVTTYPEEKIMFYALNDITFLAHENGNESENY
jgi:hypothetical protein